MRKYKDGLGHVYNVPDYAVEEFERRRRVSLRIAIVIKAAFLAALLAWSWSH